MHKWVALHEHLPDLHTSVLITDGRRIAVAQWLGHVLSLGATPVWEPVGFLADEWAWDLEEHAITHWMSLPALPDEKEL